ncbi:hypothetical protein F4780DRAFT_742638 [Xylariomycetidae sp. FL0641]|nr:hypothetical protein F4780DRAFT_742638 [Xylariomycetidae sp. FL0641]
MVSGDIAIIGLSFKLAGKVEDEFSLWDVLQSRRNLMTPWPEARGDISGFHDPSTSPRRKTRSLGAHFIHDDPAAFDAPFFAITAKEAAAMDPEQRLSLETSYRALENAGLPLEKIKGSRMAVLSASVSNDYARMAAKDPGNAPRTTYLGTNPSMSANRISWFLGLVGPSVHVNTACSSGLVAVDTACQYIRSGDASSALVVAANLILGPETTAHMAHLNMLSPDGLSYGFDGRANGYGRGEGVVAIVLKTVADAVKDGDMIRAVVRASGTNHDGRTLTMMQPNPDAQTSLIRHVYRKAGLRVEDTHYVEAHGTGTPVGDPIEMKAIDQVFGSSHSNLEPVFVGSIKANIGHLEGCSGLASIVKAILILEKGVIPPQALFGGLNPAIKLTKQSVKIATESTPWPTRSPRRVSINSFGIGGTNSHLILEAAADYLEQQCDAGAISPGALQFVKALPPARYSIDGLGTTESVHPGPTLLVWSATQEKSLAALMEKYDAWWDSGSFNPLESARMMAYTLAERRSHHIWRTFAVVGDPLDSTGLLSSKPIRSQGEPKAVFVFTGQGAQRPGMGMELRRYPVFRRTLKTINRVLRQLGCQWSLFRAMEESELINQPEYSQPLTTALQIALCRLLKSFGVAPAAAVGHSSGEIAAAYCVNALSLESACRVAYYRGKLAEQQRAATASEPGAMMSVNLPAADVHEYLEERGLISGTKPLQVACINSPRNCTLSGSEQAIDAAKAQLDRDGVFALKLNTGIAYHSLAMEAIASEYMDLLGALEPGPSSTSQMTILMASTVTGSVVNPPTLLTPRYWADNLVNPVKFESATLSLVGDVLPGVTDLVELGPHGALRRPLLDCLAASRQKASTRYFSALDKNHSPTRTVLELMGSLFCHGYPVSIAAGNLQDPGRSGSPFLVDCPSYVFDHTNRYWDESRLSRDYRLVSEVHGELLGKRALDWNPFEPTWRKFLNVDASPWLVDHVVLGTPVLPGSALLLVALEAVSQMASAKDRVSGYLVKEAHFMNAVQISTTRDETELVTRLRPVHDLREKELSWFETKIFTHLNGRWTECFRSIVQVQYQEAAGSFYGRAEDQLFHLENVQHVESAFQTCRNGVGRREFYEYSAKQGGKYGKWFQLLQGISWDGKDKAAANVDATLPEHLTASLVHPAVLDTAFQLQIAVASKGISRLSPMLVPSQISNAWFSSSGWQQPQTSLLRTVSIAQVKPDGQGLHVEAHILSDRDTPLCVMEKVVFAPIADGGIGCAVERHMLHGIRWRPQLSYLTRDQLHHVCHADWHAKDESSMELFCVKLASALDRVVRVVLQQLGAENLQRVPASLQMYVRWMNHHVEQHPPAQVLDRRGDDASQGSLEAVTREIDQEFERLNALKPGWRLYTAIAKDLKGILTGKVDPLSLAFDTSLAAEWYDSVFETLSDSRFRVLLELVVHEKANLSIIEVGAGTGAWTAFILRFLRDFEKRTGQTAYLEYVYTDISTAFFEKAECRFSEFKERMSFKPYNLERRALDQGFEPHTFDLVIAGSVLHATADLPATIRNVRQLLKPGGHLISAEPVKPEKLLTNFAFGVFPGWGAAKEGWRTFSPVVGKGTWDKLLEENGFSGTDLVIDDYRSEGCHLMSVLLSTAERQGLEATDSHGSTVLLVVNPQSTCQADVARRLEAMLSKSSWSTKILPLDLLDLDDLIDADAAVSLVELDVPTLDRPSPLEFQNVKTLVEGIERLLWVSSSLINSPRYASASMVRGFGRCMRLEEIGKDIVTLTIESEGGGDLTAEHVETVFSSSFVKGMSEVDYIVREGKVMTGRLVHEPSLSEKLHALSFEEMKTGPWLSGPVHGVKLVVGTPGLLDTLYFREDKQPELGADEVEIEAVTWGLSFRDVFAALGRLEDMDLGFGCAGTVKRAGPESEFQPGVAVCMFTIGCIRTYPRQVSKLVSRLPESMTTETATASMMPAATALYALIDVAHLKKGEKVLVHSASGGTGQMAIQIAKMIGAEIFATVGDEGKKRFLVETFGIANDHVFCSRSTAFAKGIKRVTNGAGVDVVLNSLSGTGLRVSWECVAPFGRFIDLGRADILANAGLPMGGFAGNISYSAIDLRHLLLSNQALSSELFRNTMNLLARGIINHPVPIHKYPVSEVESAFRFIQSGKSMGRVLLTAERSDLVQKYVREYSSWKLDSAASYLISGGLGGVGRAIIGWMVDRGARYLIVPSRSGVGSQAASELVAKLQHQGVVIATPKCDVSSYEELAEVVRECTEEMPRIKGCINASMVLQDAILENMTHGQWCLATASKAQTSWNLHCLLPSDLDFFILLSSLAGILGSVAQSNYAAGCVYQDALARHRVSLDPPQKAISLDIGWLRSIGIISETDAYSQRRRNVADMREVDDIELLGLLDLCCDPSMPVMAVDQAQVLLGLITPANFRANSLPLPEAMTKPLFAGFTHTAAQRAAVHEATVSTGPGHDLGRLFGEAATMAEKAEVVVQGLKSRLANALSIDAADVESRKSLSHYGVDSLMSVELRNWLSREFQADVEVFDIMGGGRSIVDIGGMVVEKSGVGV